MSRALRILSLLFFLLPASIVGQIGEGCHGPTFVQFLRDDAGADVRATCVLSYPGASGDILLGGTVGENILLARLDADGNLRWRRVISSFGQGTELSTLNELVVDPAGMIAGVGSTFSDPNVQQAYLFRYDPLADRVLYFVRPEFPSQATGISLVGQDEYLISGGRFGEPPPVFNSAYLLRVRREDGSAIAPATLFDFKGDESFLNLQHTTNGLSYAVGNISATGGPGDTRASISQLNSEGALNWSLNGPVGGNVNARLLAFDVEVIDNKIYLLQWGNIGNITGSVNTTMILSVFTLAGEVESTMRYDVLNFSGEEGIELVPHADGLLIYGFSLIGRRQPFLLQITTTGEVAWGRTYDLAGNATLYLRANQQLFATPTGIFAVGTYSYPNGRPREGLLMKLSPEGLSDNSCLEQEELRVQVTSLASIWEPTILETAALDVPWQAFSSQRLPNTLSAYDDCDTSCDDCAVRTLLSESICLGDSLLLSGSWRFAEGVYADTLPSSTPGCDSIVLTEVLVSAGPTATYAINRQCGFAEAEVLLAVSGGIFPYSFSWSVPNISGERVNLPAGSYQVRVDDVLGCAPLLLEVEVPPASRGAPSFRVDAPNCPGEASGRIRLEPRGSGSLRLLPAAAYQPDELTELSSGTYQVVLRDSAGCEAFRQIIIPPSRPVSLEVRGPQTIRLGDEISLFGTSATGNLFTNYRWSIPDSSACRDCPETRLQPNASGMVSLSATTVAGCPAKDSLFLRVLDDRPRLYLPTAFSPNGDALNDSWVPGLGKEVQRIISWSVFDRWGGLRWAYNGADFWTGDGLAPGAYPYQIEVELINGRRIHRKGMVMLVR